MTAKSRERHRMERIVSTSISSWRSEAPRHQGERFSENAAVDCGWGKLIFGHTFTSHEALLEAMRLEPAGTRNLALYLRDPHVVLALAPQDLFLDPSHTYRLWFANYLPARIQPAGFVIRRIKSRSDAREIHRLLMSRGMVSGDPSFVWEQRKNRVIEYFVAEDPGEGRIVGTVMGVDHVEAFQDPEKGASMWCLAVDPNAEHPGVGRSLVAHVADFFAARGRAYMDLSVMHDNAAVIELYEQMGFVRVPAFCVKRRNAINQDLFIGDSPSAELNPYAQIIVDEASRRGIATDVLDAEHGYFALQYGGRRIICRESLSELTSAVAMSRCDDKAVTHRLLDEHGVRVPRQQVSKNREDDEAFLRECGSLVVKPAQGEQGRGVHVDVRDTAELETALGDAAETCQKVVLEEYVEGEDLRVVVIDYRVVAAAIRRPAQVTGTGKHTIRALIEKQSRRRAAATGGESSIPIDEETERCLALQDLNLDDILAEGRSVPVRKTANLHTGGTLHDVTERLSDTLRDASEHAAKTLNIPVVGLDFIIESAESEDYVLIEANERPGLANHEPQPTAERFVDLLFPQTVADNRIVREQGRTAL